jgi:FkbM family methyltransferase
MMSVVTRLGRRIGNQLYKTAFPFYRPLYSAFKCYADHAERHLLARHLSAGCVVVDAGANIGIYSKFLAQCVGPRGTVHSFEPSPENFARLHDALSDFPNVRLNQLAVSDKTEESLLYVSDDLNVDHRAYPTEGESRRTVSIRSTSLDDYFKPGQRVDLIKVDIQGYELHALRGARRVLADNPNVKLLLEFWPYGLLQAGVSAEAFLSYLRDAGFTTFVSEANKLLQCDQPSADPTDSMSYFNLFAQKVT